MIYLTTYYIAVYINTNFQMRRSNDVIWISLATQRSKLQGRVRCWPFCYSQLSDWWLLQLLLLLLLFLVFFLENVLHQQQQQRRTAISATHSDFTFIWNLILQSAHILVNFTYDAFQMSKNRGCGWWRMALVHNTERRRRKMNQKVHQQDPTDWLTVKLTVILHHTGI